MNAVTVTTPGISCVTDLGRFKGSTVGQMTGGAMDQVSARTANVLVARPPAAPLVELMALDFAATTDTALLVSVTGAPAEVSVSGVPVPQWEPFLWPAHTELRVAALRVGLRCYIAIHAELDAPRLLGSCAPDSVLGFSGNLRAGDTIPLEAPNLLMDHPYFGIPVFRLQAPVPRFTDSLIVPVTDGPDRDDFGRSAGLLFDRPFTVGPNSNHVGLRLSAASQSSVGLPRRVTTTEVLSRGVPMGAVEVPPGDELMVLHRGRGVTAGYPVLAVVTTVGLSQLAQARPGHSVAFVPVTVEEAVAASREQARLLDELGERVLTVLSTYGIHP